MYVSVGGGGGGGRGSGGNAIMVLSQCVLISNHSSEIQAVSLCKPLCMNSNACLFTKDDVYLWKTRLVWCNNAGP